MLNQVVLVGRLIKEPTIIKEGENHSGFVVIAVPRQFKNEIGEYETDIIDVVLLEGIAKNTAEFCKKGDVIGVKGSIRRLEGEELKIVADKITFLSSSKVNNNE